MSQATSSEVNVTSAHFFTGGGGDLSGFKEAGIKPVMALEVGRDRCQTLRHNHPGLKVLEQPIGTLTLDQYPPERALVHVFTYPCQKYSLASALHGQWQGDSLYLEALREAVLLWPEVLVVENVVGMRHFPRVMETWRRLPGYYCTEMLVRGEWFGLQKKTRLFLVLHRQAHLFKSLQFYTEKRAGETLADYLDSPDDEDQPLKNVPEYVYKRLDGDYRDRPNIYRSDQTEPINLTTNYKRDRSNHLVYDDRYPRGVRPFAVKELARLHGFPDSYQFWGNLGERYAQVIDCVMPSVAKALGLAIRGYFEAIGELAVPLRPLGYHKLYPRLELERPVRTTAHQTGYVQTSFSLPLPAQGQGE